jgi:hypothetical protein
MEMLASYLFDYIFFNVTKIYSFQSYASFVLFFKVTSALDTIFFGKEKRVNSKRKITDVNKHS